MERKTYLNKLNILASEMMKNKPTPFYNFIKVLCLTTMNMRYEKIAFHKDLKIHPYILTKNIIEDTINMFRMLCEIDFIEDDDKNTADTKYSDLVKKHKILWQEIWSRHSYDEFKQFIKLKAMRLEANNLINKIKGRSCIDLGCGNGSFSFALISKGAKSVTGIDFGNKSIEYAKNYAKQNKMTPFAKFLVGDIKDIPVEQNKFGFAVANGVFHHLPAQDIPLALNEVNRVLEKGGWFWYYVDGKGAISMDLWDQTVEILSEVNINEIEAHLIPLNIKRAKMVHIMDSSNATYIHTDWDEVTNMLKNAGFGNFKRLTGATSTDFDHDTIESDKWGKEKFGSGDLRIVCQKIRNND